MQIGLIGVGFVGKLFADALREADYPLIAYDVDEDQMAYAVDRGATAAESPTAVAESADAIVLSLPGAPEVEAVLSDEGLLGSLDGDHLVVDTSTTGPETAAECERRCTDRGAAFLTAPFTRAAPRAGVLMLAGGDAAVYEAAGDLLDCLAADHVRVGGVADAQTYKLAVQMRYAGRHAVDGEVVAFVRDRGLDPALLNEFLEMGLSERYVDREFGQAHEGMGGLEIWHKDLGYALESARREDAAVPLAAATHEAFKFGRRSAGPEDGHAATVLRYWERLNGRD